MIFCLIFYVVGFAVGPLAAIILIRISPVTVAVAMKEMRRIPSLESVTSIVTCIIIVATKLT